jgi:CheY-like chemotaxis protein
MAKILFVDADAERIRQVTEALAGRGHVVVAATCAERAMICVDRERQYDAIVLHLVLPGMDGAELCRWLKRQSCVPTVPRVVFTCSRTEVRIDLSEGLPSWLPADVFLDSVEGILGIVQAVEGLLRAGGGPPQSTVT